MLQKRHSFCHRFDHRLKQSLYQGWHLLQKKLHLLAVSATFRDNEAAYLAGVAAANETKTNKVGFVGGEVAIDLIID
jgi:basic membrane lipoprotein Med (substrate-binding protein (PBP1-ABC) superfamily)